jgi:pyruvate/2-oxoglutarate dehydrogenase complex dihydrolipoamide acyltransferase (E2) component
MKNERMKVALVSLLLPMVAFGAAAAIETTGTETPAGVAAAPVAAAPVTNPAAAKSKAAAPGQALPLPAPTEREVELGIQLAHVGLTASGGLVDVRFKVLDAVKAKALLADATNAPALIAGDMPPLAAPHHSLRGARYAKGQIFYILYPNQRSAIQPGGEVTVALGPVRLGPVKAQ